jgi:hypothetical protein
MIIYCLIAFLSVNGHDTNLLSLLWYDEVINTVQEVKSQLNKVTQEIAHISLIMFVRVCTT